LIDFHFSEVIGRRLLIVGDVGSGKTAMTARLLAEAVSMFDSNDIAVIDMAPEKRYFNQVAVGGRLTDFIRPQVGLRVLVPARKVGAPRIEGRTASDVLRLARLNAQSIDQLLDRYTASPSPILFINDVSIYLQAGEPRRLLKVFASAKTMVANSYEGSALQDDHGSGVSRREREGLAVLKKAVDKVLTASSVPSLALQLGAGK
jgi:hypothetical protein